MRKIKRSHGTCRLIDDFIKNLNKRVGRRTTNNYRKMHGLPMRRKGGIY